MTRQELDPVTSQAIGGALDTIAEEMGHILYRMSFSSIIRESQDLGARLFDTDFNTLCDSESDPLHIGSLPGYSPASRERSKAGSGTTATWSSTTILLGSSHSPESPSSSRVPRGRAGSVLRQHRPPPRHRTASPGLIIDLPDVYAEGMLFAGTKLYEEGLRNEAMWEDGGAGVRHLHKPDALERTGAVESDIVADIR